VANAAAGAGMMVGNQNVPLSIPLPFLLTGACAAALFGLLLPWLLPEALLAPDFPHVLALVHIATLGWLTMTIMGASLQLVPVIIVGPLRAARLLPWQYPLYLASVTLLVCGFWFMRPWLIIAGGAGVVLAVAHYVIVLAVTLARAPRRPLTVRFLVASLVYLCLVVCLGLTAALNLQWDFLGTAFDRLLPLHITLGVVGWLSATLFGVSYTLARMFSLSHAHDDRLGRIVFVLLNASLVVLAGGLLVPWPPLTLPGGMLLTFTAWLFAYDYRRLLRLRFRKLLDVTQYHSIAAVVCFALLVPASLLVVMMGWEEPAVLAALVLAALVGWLGQSMIGYLYKIVPFLVWQHRYGPLAGRQKVPLMREMLHERLAWLSWWAINAGLIATLCAMLLHIVWLAQLTGGVLGLGLALAACNIAGVVRHLRNP
jgi:cbb3-type cytochrome oxidase subunit 1